MNNPEAMPGKPPRKTGRGMAYLLFGVGAIPVVLAFVMYFGGTMIPDGRTNNGSLMLPPLDLTAWELSAETQIKDGNEERKWQLIVVGDGECINRCQEALHIIRQVNTALGREAKRVEHSYIELNRFVDPALLKLIRQEYPNLQVFFADRQSVLRSIELKLEAKTALQESYIFIADPLGNIMMHYTPENIGRDILDDMKRLLKVSKIG